MPEQILSPPPHRASPNNPAPWSFIGASRADAKSSDDRGRVEFEMADARLGVLASLYVSLRAKHGPAAAHSMRVGLWASAWGLQAQLKEEQLQLLEIAGLLHEIGKIGIPDRVLQKPDRLNDNEQQMMDLHRQVGVEILKSAGASSDLLLAIAGVGTKFGTSSNCVSNEIAPIASRLINVIDAYDSMTTNQVYRKAISRESALAELFRQGGSQFDPRLVRSFAEVVLAPRQDLQDQVSQRWLTKIEPSEYRRFFNLDKCDDGVTIAPTERAGSALVQSLNDTFYRHMMDHVQDGVIFVDSEYRVLDWNSSAERMTGRTAASVFHHRWVPNFACLCDEEGFSLSEEDCPIRDLLQSGMKISRKLSIRREGHALMYITLEVIPVFNDRGYLCGGAMILEDVSEAAMLARRIIDLRERACQDQLTKVSNRGELNRQLPDFVSYHQKTDRPGSVIICDIDFFKKINDNFSHQVGDEALKVFANVLKESCRESDFVARFGGEEFVLLCSECTFSEAKEFAETIRRRLQRTPIAAIRNACITASFGVSSVLPGDTGETVLERADQGLMIAKENGRDRVVGLGLDEKTEPAAEAPSGSWLSWFTPVHPAAQTYELVTNVPRAVTLEKIKGFVSEFRATVLDVQNNRVILEVDCRHAPIPHGKNERLGKFRIALKVSELEVEAGGKKASIKTCTLLEVEISPVRNRDRRNQAIISQASRLKTALQGFVVAHEMDDELRAKVLRRVKDDKESRY